MRTTWGFVNISGSLLLFIRKILEETTCQGLVALVAPGLILRRRPAAAAGDVLFPLLDPDLLDLALFLFTGMQ